MNSDKHIESYHKCTDKVNLNGLKLDYTTPEQSKRLIELGVPIESANIVYYHTPDSWYDPYLITENRHIENLKSGKGLPCWSVGRLIEIHLKCCTTLNQNDAHVVISRFRIETGGLLQNMYDMVSECALLGKYDFSKIGGVMDYNDEKLGAICGCDDIINLCNRITSGNIVHNIAAIRNAAQEIKKYLSKLGK